MKKGQPPPRTWVKKKNGRASPTGRPAASPFIPRISSQLKPILREIGVPEERPFRPDPFQVQALARLNEGDVVVAAPTGAGKTYIAVEAMADVLAKGGRAWYASPLKALSNAKYLEFGQRFGSPLVGLLTGDHKVNPDAPLIVGTTEILRNQLYDAMSQGVNLATNLVVMDEAHYLGDPERGVVWEEVIIYLPARVRLLLLSATIANAREIADWLAHIRKNRTATVITHQRPVPLHPLFLFPDGELDSLAKGRSLSPKVRHFLERHPRRGPGPGRSTPAYGRVIAALEKADLLPAIFFLKSRADCDQALSRCWGRSDAILADRREQRLNQLLERYPFLRSHAHLKYIRGPGLAAHHAGHMPHWKLLVENLMQAGLLKAIFSTSTVAAGVNFPARTVVLCQSDRYNGREFTDLTATELLQMTGRAGRRGMDRIGFALVVPGPFQNPFLIHALFQAEPDPVSSRIQINFSMTLNLLQSHPPEQIRNLLELSLAAFLQGRFSLDEETTAIRRKLDRLLQGGRCQGPEYASVLYQTRKRLEEEAIRLEQARPKTTWETALRLGLEAGRLFLCADGQIYCVLELKERRGKSGVVAAKVRPDLGLKKGRVRRKWHPLNKITSLLTTRLDIGPETKPQEAMKMIRDAAGLDPRVLNPRDLARRDSTGEMNGLEARLKTLKEEQDRLACRDCELASRCLDESEGGIAHLLGQLRRFEDAGPQSSHLLWTSFLRHFEFLKSEEFVNLAGELTPDGLWAARLRLDHPLLIAAGIRSGAWPEDNPALLASAVAPFVVDKEIESEEAARPLPPELLGAWFKLESAVEPTVQRLKAAGFGTPKLNLRAALAVYSWARLGLWEEAVRLYGLDPGDMAMLVFRAADNLRQMAALADTHPRLAATARTAVGLILKEPVLVPL
ncbi:MAG: DEAD/DEAH box helicase [Thermodesulfobacteriota bacterium]